MVGFPKVIKTKADLVNTFKLVKKGKLKKADWLAAVEKLEKQNWIDCPVLEKSEDRKTVTLMFCNEVSAGDKVRAGSSTATVVSVLHEDIEKDIAPQAETDGGEQQDAGRENANSTTKHTIITLSKVVPAGMEILGVPAAVTYYERLGITEEEVQEMKGELA